MKQPTRAVVFVTDARFLVPTLVAARQVQAQVEPDRLADIIVILIGFDAAAASRVTGIIEQEGFLVLHMPEVALPGSVAFNKNHVPTSALARLLIADILPARYENIVYMDGDIQIVGDIRPLVLHTVRDGHVAAANDKFWLGSFGRWRSQRTYLDGLQIEGPEHYFNSGILAFRRQTWVEMAPLAFRFFLDHSALCRYHDQSALNAVFRGRREVLPPTYNFITDYVMMGQGWADARILHFTGGLKPWYYFGTPWRDQFRADYDSLLTRQPGLRGFVETKTAEEQQAMQSAHTRRMLLLATLFPPLNALRRRRYRRYLSDTPFALP